MHTFIEKINIKLKIAFEGPRMQVSFSMLTKRVSQDASLKDPEHRTTVYYTTYYKLVV